LDLSCSLLSGVHQRGVTSLCLDANFLFSGSHDNTIKLYDIDTLAPLATLTGHSYTIWALTSDGKHLYSGSNDHYIRVWDLETYQCVKMSNEHNSKIFHLELKDDLLFSTGDRLVKIWDKDKLQPTAELKGHSGGINSIRIQDNHVISGASDKTLRLWDLTTQTCITEITAADSILSLAVADNLVFAGLQNCCITAFDLRSHQQVGNSMIGHWWQVWQLILAGGYLFSGSFDHKIKAWDIRTFENLRTLQGHRSYVHAMAADTKRLFTGSADKSIRVWYHGTGSIVV